MVPYILVSTSSYLLKQQELIVKSEMATELGEKVSEVDTLKDLIKAQRAANRASQDFLTDYSAKVDRMAVYADKIHQLRELAAQIPQTDERHQGKLVNETYAKLIELLEGSIQAREDSARVLRDGYTQQLDTLKTNKDALTAKTGKVK